MFVFCDLSICNLVISHVGFEDRILNLIVPVRGIGYVLFFPVF